MLKDMKRGFTVVEIFITIAIMGILLTLAVVSMRSAIAQANDTERAEDIATIARGLEQYYENGNPFYISGNTKGSYPGSNTIISISGAGWCDTAYFKNASQAANYSVCREYWGEALPGVSAAAMTPPGRNDRCLGNPWLAPENNPVEIMMPAITDYLNDNCYVYKPLNDNNDSLCYSDTSCRRYVLLYKKETTGEIVIVRSKRQ